MGYLDALVASAHVRVEELRAAVSTPELQRLAAASPRPRGFAAALARREIAFVAEVKRVSPAAGPLQRDLDAAELAAAYARGGAAAISVLTESAHFEGSLEDLVAVGDTGLPILRKDFILDPLQVLESRVAGADAVLLIERVVHDRLPALIELARGLGMDALVEVHDEDELDRAIGAGASLVGVNHRDLETFEVDPRRTATLRPLVPAGVRVVALSGVSTRAEVEALAAAGADAVLVGEALVTASDPEAKLRELRGET